METKGDTQIVIHYDGSIRPSEIRIESIGLWVHFYDLLAAMMKEVVAKQLGGGGATGGVQQDGYLATIRVAYPLTKPLQPKMTVRIKGRRTMEIGQ
jgi:hypothetical protein